MAGECSPGSGVTLRKQPSSACTGRVIAGALVCSVGRRSGTQGPRWRAWPIGKIFDRSELQAWRSGNGLHGVLQTLNEKYPGKVRTFAHSHGNITVGEAMKIETTGGNNRLLHTYIANQAAIASQLYDNTITNRSFAPTDDNTPNVYAYYWYAGQPSYLNSVGSGASLINFFNPDDYALRVAWQINQNLKPDEDIFWHYGYGSDTNPPAFGHFHKYTGLPQGGGNYTALWFPTNRFEIFAFAAEARCLPLGQQAGMHGGFDSAKEVDLDLTFEFGDQREGHSAEWGRASWQVVQYWDRLLKRFSLKAEQ